MKKIIALCVIATLLSTCKKKTADPTPQPTPTPTSVTYLYSVKVDGTAKNCSSSSCYSSIYSGGLRDITLDLNSSIEQIFISWDKAPKTGVFNIVEYGQPFLAYYKGSNSYAASTGTINITNVDTSSTGVINKLTATFSFKTDTLNGLFFNLTEGSINLK